MPTRVRLGRLGIDARLVPLGVDENNVLEPPPYGVAGWWRAGPEPGEPGPAVIAGHVDSQEGPDTFYGLAAARRGDRIAVSREDGSAVHFTVTEVRSVPRDRFPTHQVYGDTERPRLRLVTCGGPYDEVAGAYEDNVIVFAKLA